MDILKQLNDAIAYIEENICNEIDTDKIAQIALCSYDKFSRFFSYMTGMTIAEYIRKRKLTLAAYELMNSNLRVIDVAVKYGYNSADAFSRAFVKQHGILPTEVGKSNGVLKVYPPASFHITIKGAAEMKFKIIENPAIKLKGISRKFTGQAKDRFEQDHIMWADHHDDVQNQVCRTVEGIWYGVWNKGVYSIAKNADEIDNPNLENITIPQGNYAVFSTDVGGFAGEELPKLREQIFDCWLPDSGHVQTSDYEIEVYYLYPKYEKHKRHYEIWIPVMKVYGLLDTAHRH